MLIGKIPGGYLTDGISLYERRLSHYIPFEIKTLPDLRSIRGLTEDQQKQKEGDLILNAISASDTVILLDERGKELTSREFADMIDHRAVSGVKNLIFVVGGPYGFSGSVYDRADGKIALSRMTFSHEMVRLFFVEQLYRAMTILKGEPYHHD